MATANCPVCDEDFDEDTIGLEVCINHHLVCRRCVEEHCKSSMQIPIACPEGNCNSSISDAVVEQVLDKEYFEGYRKKVQNSMIGILEQPFQCQADDCDYICEIEGKQILIICPKCKAANCLRCRAVHKELNCKEYQASKKTTIKPEDSMLVCPVPYCGTPIKKISGCGFVVCAKCKTDLCWYNKSTRWGPKGCGDTSGGCRCRVNGIKCHPDCDWCSPGETFLEEWSREPGSS